VSEYELSLLDLYPTFLWCRSPHECVIWYSLATHVEFVFYYFVSAAAAQFIYCSVCFCSTLHRHRKTEINLQLHLLFALRYWLASFRYFAHFCCVDFVRMDFCGALWRILH